MSFDWKQTGYLWDIWMTPQLGEAAVAARGRRRLAELVRYARSRSPFYQRLYRELPGDCHELPRLPPVNKRQLMAAFDDWVTDRKVRRAELNGFLADTGRIGHLYLDRYAVYTSSGTTGEPGVYLHDGSAQIVYEALLKVRFDPAGFVERALSVLGQRGFAMIAATGGHFAGTATWERWRQLHPLVEARVFSVALPTDELVQQLNAFQPAFVASYPSTVLLLAQEQRQGRLQLNLSAAWMGGEGLSPSVRTEIEQAFGCRTVEDYGTSEFMNIAFGCDQGWLHVNADWVLLEPVDAEFRPVPPGQPSHTVLLTNLANRVQPFIRYQLGDSITLKPERCACGNPLPAIRVGGRSDETLYFPTAGGRTVGIMPIPLTSMIEDDCHVYRFQLIQTGPSRLDVRLEVPAGADPERTWRQVETGLHDFLARHGVTGITVRRDPEPPRAERTSGKFRQVWARWEQA